MQPYNSFNDCTRNITWYVMMHASSLPAYTRNALINAQSQASTVETIMMTLEAMYAVKDKLNDDGRQLVYGLASYATFWKYHNIQEENRGDRIQIAMMRDAGEDAPNGTTWPDPADDPAPLAEYTAPPEVVTMTVVPSTESNP